MATTSETQFARVTSMIVQYLESKSLQVAARAVRTEVGVALGMIEEDPKALLERDLFVSTLEQVLGIADATPEDETSKEPIL